jgi:Probable cobalt transporter subunit (CbtA)
MGGLGAVLRATLVAGLIAGLLASVFHRVLTEPVIDRAIAAEEARASEQPGHVHEEPVVSRGGQKIGLIVGLLVYGLTWGLLVGLSLYATRGWGPAGWSLGRRGLVVAGLVGWSVALFPFLKYPANPPGVGEPETIAYRQTLYIGFIALAVLGGALAVSLRQRLRAASDGPSAWIAPVAFYGVWALAMYALMPPNPDPVELSATIVGPFRTLSLTGLIVFWGGLALALAYLGRERPRAPMRTMRPVVPAR